MALVDVIIGYAKGAQGDVGPQGPEGTQGPEGPQGPLPPLVNNALATEEGVAALDAVMGKTLQDNIDTVNSDLGDLSTMLQYPMVFKGLITGDLNRLDIPVGYYMIENSSSVTNAPVDSGYTVFVQLYGYSTQMIIGPNVRTRRYVGDPPSWLDWR